MKCKPVSKYVLLMFHVNKILTHNAMFGYLTSYGERKMDISQSYDENIGLNYHSTFDISSAISPNTSLISLKSQIFDQFTAITYTIAIIYYIYYNRL